MMLALSDITMDQSLQFRDRLDGKAVEDYADILDQLPPIIVFGDDNLLADGFHRVSAAIKAGRTEISAIRREGGHDKAIAAALAENLKATGVRMSTTERNAAIRALMDDGWNASQIGKLTGIAHATVSDIGNSRKLRQSLPADVASELADTKLYRIATLDESMQEPVARLAIERNLNEPAVRALVKQVKATGVIPDDGPVITMKDLKSELKDAVDNDGSVALTRVFTAITHLADFEPEEVYGELDIETRDSYRLLMESALRTLNQWKDADVPRLRALSQ